MSKEVSAVFYPTVSLWQLIIFALLSVFAFLSLLVLFWQYPQLGIFLPVFIFLDIAHFQRYIARQAPKRVVEIHYHTAQWQLILAQKEALTLNQLPWMSAYLVIFSAKNAEGKAQQCVLFADTLPQAQWRNLHRMLRDFPPAAMKH